MTDAIEQPERTHLNKLIPIASVRFSLADVINIYERLCVALAEQAEVELSALTKPADKTDEEFAAYKISARASAFKVTTTLSGADGTSLYGESAAVFSAVNKPNRISSIFMTNRTAYKGFSGIEPAHSFELHFDFSKPPLFDARNPVSAPTSNFSNITVGGSRDGWIAAIPAAVLTVLNDRATRRAWLHRAFSYDLGILVIGLPAAFYICWKLSSLVQAHLAPIHEFIAAAAYVYVFFVSLNVYRGLFGYTKWAFPTVELIDNQDHAAKHRATWGAIMLALAANFIWEMSRVL